MNKKNVFNKVHKDDPNLNNSGGITATRTQKNEVAALPI